ncbi:hypothetical protein V6N12_054376 [Hibiscus sabdariffa]|uniref:40S ribosomal protein S8 n=1 Tax=Hibiscus sabdariffa TaxID=183260 RepID=A0ABR2D084_9ROSI
MAVQYNLHFPGYPKIETWHSIDENLSLKHKNSMNPTMQTPSKHPLNVSKTGFLQTLMDSRKYELGRQPANTKLSSNKTVRWIRVRGGNVKILDVVYNASNNELVPTQTLVKSAIVQVDAAPFKQWYLQHYNIDIGRKKKAAAAAGKKESEEGETVTEEVVKKSNHVLRKLLKRQENRISLDPHIDEQFSSGRLLARITSRPGQCGRADGSILEGKELEFYMKKIQRKKGKGAA